MAAFSQLIPQSQRQLSYQTHTSTSNRNKTSKGTIIDVCAYIYILYNNHFAIIIKTAKYHNLGIQKSNIFKIKLNNTIQN